MKGILLIDKPAGITSYDVIRKLKKLITANSQLPAPKLGHAGTLDPMATGLLIILFGEYTKKAGLFLRLAKTYDATITLGATSSTDDAEGNIRITDKRLGIVPSSTDIESVLEGFVGTMEQIPPNYSAKKIAGVRSYKLARKGVPVKLEAKKVTIYNLELKDYKFPKVQITTTVSSGTYIRALARDMGAKLGTGAYLSGLRRTAIGEHSLSNALRLDKINSEIISKNLKYKILKNSK